MTAGENAIADAAQVNFDSLGSDVHEHNLKVAFSRIDHHSQIALARRRGFDREALLQQ